MVRRLVEEQEVRAAHERLREVEPHPQAARKLRDGFVLARDRHAEPGEQRRRARARRITADLLEAMMKRGECCTLLGIRDRGPFRRLEGTLDVTPSSTNSSAGVATAGVSCATWAIVQAAGSSTSPASAWSSPRRSANKLDLPQPFGPTSPALCPACTVRLAPSSRRIAPRASVRFEMRIKGRSRT